MTILNVCKKNIKCFFLWFSCKSNVISILPNNLSISTYINNELCTVSILLELTCIRVKGWLKVSFHCKKHLWPSLPMWTDHSCALAICSMKQHFGVKYHPQCLLCCLYCLLDRHTMTAYQICRPNKCSVLWESVDYTDDATLLNYGFKQDNKSTANA